MSASYYLAARLGHREEARQLRDKLGASDCTSTWLLPSHDREAAAGDLSDDQLAWCAWLDFADIDRAQALVLLRPLSPEPAAGMHVETGYALARGKPVLVYGYRENLFHYLPQVRAIGTVAELKRALETL